MLKAAIVGSGPAAIGVLRALSEWRPDAEVTVFDIGESADGPLQRTDPPKDWGEAYFREFYAHLRAVYGRRLLPPKTLFGLSPPTRQIGRRYRVTESRMRGGLSNFWGSSMLPFTDRELRRWPIGAKDLAPYYRRIADMVGISGRRDALNQYFGEDFVNRPPIRMTEPICGLERSINGDAGDHAFRVISGVSRLGLETRADHAHHCIHCGQCAVGCSSSALYTAGPDLQRFQATGVVRWYHAARVLSVDPKTRTLKLRSGAADHDTQAFDRVYLCAGCLGSTEIAMRSFGLRSGPSATDNAKYTFPILRLGSGGPQADEESYFALANLVIGCVPRQSADAYFQVQVYPTSEYLWRYYLPPSLWGAFQGIGRLLYRHLLWARIFVPSDQSQSYAIRLPNGGPAEVSVAREAAPTASLKAVMSSLRAAINRNGYYIPPIPLLRESTGFHYAATMPYGQGGLSPRTTGEIAPGIYACDSAAFSDGPTIPPTFTIMANACRSAHQSLDE